MITGNCQKCGSSLLSRRYLVDKGGVIRRGVIELHCEICGYSTYFTMTKHEGHVTLPTKPAVIDNSSKEKSTYLRCYECGAPIKICLWRSGYRRCPSCRPPRPRRRPVAQIEPSTGKIVRIWASVCMAARALGIPHTGIRRACQGREYNGYNWQYTAALA